MLTYRVEDMTCGHCAGTITKALHAVDAGAKVEVDLSKHLVTVESTESHTAEFAEAIAEAGYTPVRVELATAAKPTSRKGGCCGCCG